MLLFDLLRTLQKFGDSSYVDLQTVNFGAVWVGPFLGAFQLRRRSRIFPSSDTRFIANSRSSCSIFGISEGRRGFTISAMAAPATCMCVRFRDEQRPLGGARLRPPLSTPGTGIR